MNPSDDNNLKLPLWMQELLDKVKSMTFKADDTELVINQCKMPSVCESQLSYDMSYDKLKELEEEDDFTRELVKLVKSKWTGTKRELLHIPEQTGQQFRRKVDTRSG